MWIVFFLDRAKAAKLIDHDPCLFTRWAKYKKSKEGPTSSEAKQECLYFRHEVA